MSRFEELKQQANAAAGTGTPMPAYKCHKEVWAFKIAEIHRETLPVWTGAGCGSYVLGTACGKCERCKWEISHAPGMGAMIVPTEKHFAPFFVTAEYLSKHKPEVGGYYVVYKDGYKSFSPAEAFEEGYTKI
jgi:hypothetical protein